MAHVQITMLAGRTIEQKRRAVKRITDAMCEELHVKAEKLTISFVEVRATATPATGFCCRTAPT